MKKGWTGETGNGKSMLLTKMLLSNLQLNLSLAKAGYEPRKTKVLRTLGLRPQFVHKWQNFLSVFDSIDELPHFEACDVYCDDITVQLSARAWNELPLAVQDWLTACERLSNNFYFTAVNFRRVVVDFRETTDELSVVTKWYGSRRPKRGYPPVKRIWGWVRECPVSPSEFRLDSFDEAKYDGGKFHWINKKYFDVYDHMNIHLREGFSPLQHRERTCTDCGYVLTRHV